MSRMRLERFRHKGLKRLYEEDDQSGVPAAWARKIRAILAALEFADNLAEVASLPGWRLHPLKGDRLGRYAISVTGNWRITFRREGNAITDLNFEDYH